MKKIFTLVCMAFVAMSVNAQEHEPGLYECKSITWGDITWKNGNNKKDKDNNDMLFLMGTGNGYATVLAEYFYSENQGDYFTRPAYTYIDYEGGETGAPAYGLYYKLTPKVDGVLKFNTWVNKGNRKTFVVKASDGKPLEPYVDYTFDGYVNGQNQEGTNIPLYFTADEIKARHDESGTVNKYVIEKGNQAVWGWITLNVSAGESYYIYQQSSQLGFGGFEFNGESYIACIDMGEGTGILLNDDFAAVVDETGKATNVDIRGSVVTFGTSNMDAEACGGAVPTEVEADFGVPAGIEDIKTAQNTNAPMYNLAGQKVANDFKGMVLQNGKKFINK